LKAYAALALLLICFAFADSLLHLQPASEKDRQFARAIFEQLIDIDTSHTAGSITRASAEMRQRFLDAGFSENDVSLVGPNERKQNLVVRYRGRGSQKPILIVGHLDVVDAKPSDWTMDPFHFVEKDGFFYGRGTQDMKDGDAILVTDLIRLRREGYQPDRDLILALTADEENGPDDGVAWLVKNRRELLNADFAINADSGGVELDHGRPLVVGVEAAEKLYADYELTVSDRGGHSSLPHTGNPIFHLAAALDRLEHSPFPLSLTLSLAAIFLGLPLAFLRRMLPRFTGFCRNHRILQRLKCSRTTCTTTPCCARRVCLLDSGVDTPITHSPRLLPLTSTAGYYLGTLQKRFVRISSTFLPTRVLR